MILTQIKFSPRDVKNNKIYEHLGLHRIIYKIFAGHDRVLYADKGIQSGFRKVVVLSDKAPENNDFYMETKTIPDAFFKLGAYRFQIDINPVKRNKESRKLVPITNYDEIASWFADKAKKWGFETAASALTVNSISAIKFQKNDGNIVTINSANISGTIKVTDEELFIKSFRDGLGRAKAYGQGLLQLMPMKIF